MTRVQHTRNVTRVQFHHWRVAHEYRSRAVHEILHACGLLHVTRISDACDTTKIEEHTRVQRTQVST